MNRYCYALDLVDDEALIAEYENWHKPENALPGNLKNIRDAGITVMDIYRTGNRLFMIMETDENFSFERKAEMDANNQDVQQWEKMMDKFQSALPWAKPGEKWVRMDRIFSL